MARRMPRASNNAWGMRAARGAACASEKEHAMNALISAREAVVAARNDAGYAHQMAEGLAEVLNVSLAAMSSFRIFKAGNTLCQTGGHLRANHGSIYLLQPMKC